MQIQDEMQEEQDEGQMPRRMHSDKSPLARGREDVEAEEAQGRRQGKQEQGPGRQERGAPVQRELPNVASTSASCIPDWVPARGSWAVSFHPSRPKPSRRATLGSPRAIRRRAAS